jgi:hypothetical protein
MRAREVGLCRYSKKDVLRSTSMAASTTQKLAVALAFVAGALSLVAVAITAARSGRIDATPLFGGLFMLALGIAGVVRLRQLPRAKN